MLVPRLGALKGLGFRGVGLGFTVFGLGFLGYRPLDPKRGVMRDN